MVEEALPLPPPAMLDEMAPEEAAPPAPAELETYEVMVPIEAFDTLVFVDEITPSRPLESALERFRRTSHTSEI